MLVDLPFRRPLAVEPFRRLLAAHAIAGLHQDDPAAGTHGAVLTAPGGPARVTIRFERSHVRADLQVSEPADVEPVTAAVRRWLDLDADPAAITAALGTDPLLGPLLAARPGLRVLGALDGFETAVLTVLGQQVSLAAARTFGTRLITAYGASVGGRRRVFPRPATLAAIAPVELQRAVGVTHSRARTLIALAEAVTAGLPLHAAADPDQFRRHLQALPGIGPWTVEYLALRILGDRDAFPADDLVLKRALGIRTAQQATALAEPWRPWRAYALFHLWTEVYFS